MKRQDLVEVVAKMCIVEGTFLVSHGVMEDTYLDMYQAMLNSEVAIDLIRELYSRIVKCDAHYVGGMEVAGCLLGAQLVVRYPQLRGFVARKVEKPYGLCLQVDGYYPKDAKVAIIEDVLTSGQTTKKVIDLVEDRGGIVVGVFPLVDRNAGGSQWLKELGYNVDPVFVLSEILEAREVNRHV